MEVTNSKTNREGKEQGEEVNRGVEAIGTTAPTAYPFRASRNLHRTPPKERRSSASDLIKRKRDDKGLLTRWASKGEINIPQTPKQEPGMLEIENVWSAVEAEPTSMTIQGSSTISIDSSDEEGEIRLNKRRKDVDKTKAKGKQEEDKKEEKVQVLYREVDKLQTIAMELNKLLSESTNTRTDIRKKATNIIQQVKNVQYILGQTPGYMQRPEMTNMETQTDTKNASDMNTQTDRQAYTKEENVETMLKITTQIAKVKGYNEFLDIAKERWPNEMFQKIKEKAGDVHKTDEDSAIIYGNETLISEQEKMEGVWNLFDLDKLNVKHGQVLQIKSSLDMEEEEGERKRNRQVYYIYTKQPLLNETDGEILSQAFKKIREMMIERGTKKVVIPRIGPGKEGITWTFVKKILVTIFQDTEIEIEVLKGRMARSQKQDRMIEAVTDDQENNEDTEAWSTVVARRKVSKNRNTIEKRKTQETVSKKVKEKPEAVLVKKNADTTYAELIKNIKSKVDLNTTGVTITGMRKTNKGDLLIEIKKGQGKAEDLRNEIVKADCTTSEVRLLSKGTARTTILIKDMEEGTTEQEIKESIANMKYGREDTSMTEIKTLRQVFASTMTAIVVTTERVADELLEKGRVKIGWVSCRIRKFIKLVQCYNCLGYEHIARNCKSDKQTIRCLKCGEQEHKSKDCQKELTCLSCKEKGHRTGTFKCREYRAALEEVHKKARVQSAAD